MMEDIPTNEQAALPAIIEETLPQPGVNFVPYSLTFLATRELTLEETAHLSKKLVKAVQHSPFGVWKPGEPDHPTLMEVFMHKEIDPLLGYDKKWLIAALLDHLAVTRHRLKRFGLTNVSLAGLKFSLSRIDEFAGEKVPGLDDLRAKALENKY